MYPFIQGCGTTSGHRGPNKLCVFPFIYKQISYSQCIANDHTKLWCSTEVDANGKYNGKWGNCDSNCGHSKLRCSYLLPDVIKKYSIKTESSGGSVGSMLRSDAN